MLSYKIGRSIGRDEEDFNKIYLNRPIHYRPFDLDYNKNFKAYLLFENMKFFISEMEGVTIINSDMALKLVNEHFGPILNECINGEFNSEVQVMNFLPAWDSAELTQDALEFCAKHGKLAGWLAEMELINSRGSRNERLNRLLERLSCQNTPITAETDEAKEKRQNFLKLLAFFDVIDTEAKFRDIIPKSMYSRIKGFLELMVSILAEGYSIMPPKDILEKIEYREAKPPNPESEAFKIDSMDGIRIEHNMIIINGYEFKTAKDKRFLEDILDINDKSILMGVCFQDCCFNSDANVMTEAFGHVQFQNCRFDKRFRSSFILEGRMEFDGCTFYSDLDFSNLQFNSLSSVYIENCFFEKGSVCDFSRIHIHDDMGSIRIRNTQFNGELRICGVNDEFYVEMKNVSFSTPFMIQDIKIKNNSEFENLCFTSMPSIQMDKARKDLYDVMKNSGLEQRAIDLGILPPEKDTSNAKFDYDAYQIAYNSGFLKPEFAAYFLGKSKVYLAKKRTQDKKKLVRDSLPFKVDGKDIQYPVEALLAFKAKDWDTLKKLRQKYPMSKGDDK